MSAVTVMQVQRQLETQEYIDLEFVLEKSKIQQKHLLPCSLSKRVACSMDKPARLQGICTFQIFKRSVLD